MTRLFPAWFYHHREEARVFLPDEDVPTGWRDYPFDDAETAFNGADPAAFDHDLDGRPGGSIAAATEETVELQPKRRGRPPKVKTDGA